MAALPPSPERTPGRSLACHLQFPGDPPLLAGREAAWQEHTEAVAGVRMMGITHARLRRWFFPCSLRRKTPRPSACAG